MALIGELTVHYEPEVGRRLEVGRLARDGDRIQFAYDDEFLSGGLEISPLRLPLRDGWVTGSPEPFAGLMGVFEDSLPDGWGRQLVDRRAATAGLSPTRLGPLDRLSLIGARGMGALVYEPDTSLAPPARVELPAIAADIDAVLAGTGEHDLAMLDRLVALGGAPQGARPKVLLGRHLVKFLAPGDDAHAGVLEHAYARMAAAAGIAAPTTAMLGGHFASERFDRVGRTRIHMHSAAGLLEVSPWFGAVGYEQLLRLTRALTRDEAAVTEMFRRACFNVLAHNRDDHSRNVAFLMDERGRWRLAPAYDVTFTDGPGGLHHAHVAGERANPGERHLLALAASAAVTDARAVLEVVRAAVAAFPRIADEAGVPATVRARVASVLRGHHAPPNSSSARP